MDSQMGWGRNPTFFDDLNVEGKCCVGKQRVDESCEIFAHVKKGCGREWQRLHRI